jgi:flagellar basal-body rod modification protein FlgD
MEETMSTVSGITGGSTLTTQSNSGSSQVMLNQQQFLQLLTAQLQNQDPMNPISSQDFTTQLAQLSTVSGLQQLNGSIQQLLQLQQLSQGAALMGKTVTYSSSGNTAAGKGVVQGVSLQNGQLQVQVGGQQVPLSLINGIAQS